MSELAIVPVPPTHRPTRSLGFNTRVSFDDDAGPAQGLRDGLAAADEIVLFLPPAFGPDGNVALITDLATTVTPVLGWRPG